MIRRRDSILTPRVQGSYNPNKIVGKGIILLFAIVGLIDVLTAGAMWK